MKVRLRWSLSRMVSLQGLCLGVGVVVRCCHREQVVQMRYCWLWRCHCELVSALLCCVLSCLVHGKKSG
ncbi:unnamed protein product [Brassica oleracea var. botrytis]